MRTRTEPYGMHLGYADGDLFGLGEDGGADKKLDRLREKAQLMPVLKRTHPARLLQIMCKPPEWCKIEASHRRFYYGQKESHAGRKGPAGENP